MPNITTDVGKVASAWEATITALTDFFKGAKGRRTRNALDHAQEAFKRALELYPDLIKDKKFKTRKEAFDDNLI